MKYPLLLIIIIVIVLSLGGYLWSRSQTPSNTVSNVPVALNPAANVPTNKKLNLSNQGLKKIPDNVFRQTGLEYLDVSHNQLTGAIQAEIRQLKNLKVLDASHNQMTGVPAEIGQLSQLEVLDLSDNQLTGLPYELGNLRNLKTLNISGNKYSSSDLNIIIKDLPLGVEIIK